jgi:protein-tyrosine phosphatase
MAARRGLEQAFDVDSAGTYAGHAGEVPDARMCSAARRRGYRLTHRARPFRRDDFERFDSIVVMDNSNYKDVCALAPDAESAQKVVRMATFCRRHSVSHVPDPYYEGRQGFERVLDILEDACENWLSEWPAERG